MIGYSYIVYYEWICFFLGEVIRKGFYLYDDRRKVSLDFEIKKYIEKVREIFGVSIDFKVCVLIFFYCVGYMYLLFSFFKI